MKRSVIFLISLLLFNIALTAIILAEEDIPGVPAGWSDEKIEQDIERIQQLQNQSRWDYLGKEWRTMALKNPVIAYIDPIFTKFSIVFRILFGVPYSFSIALLFIIILWLTFALRLGGLLSAFEFPRAKTGYYIGFLSATVLSQIKLWEVLTNWIGRLLYSPENDWLRYLLIATFFIIMFLLNLLGDKLNKALAEKKKKIKEKSAEQTQKQVKKFAEGISDAMNNLKG